jgi:hypothetical protein
VLPRGNPCILPCSYTDAVNARRLTHPLFATVLLVLGAVAQPASAYAMAPRPVAAAPGTAQQAEQASDVRLESPAFRLIVPFRTQKDGSRWQGSNCGPAALGMILDGFGIADQATDDLRFRAHTYQGTVGMRTGTALEHIAHVAEDFGVGTHGLYNPDGSWHYWEIGDVVSELRQGHPVMPLVRLYQVPGYEGSLPRWGHYILLTGIAPGGFYFSDPLKTDPVAGTSGFISEWQLKSAIDNSHIPGQALAFSGPRDLPVWLP